MSVVAFPKAHAGMTEHRRQKLLGSLNKLEKRKKLECLWDAYIAARQRHFLSRDHEDFRQAEHAFSEFWGEISK